MGKKEHPKPPAKPRSKTPSPWRCTWCNEEVEGPEDLASNPANLPYHKKCWPKAKDAGEQEKFTPRTESLSENGVEDDTD